MEQKTKKSLNSALEGLLKRFEKGEKFVLAEAPAVCKELVIEILINNAMWIIFCFYCYCWWGFNGQWNL